MKNNIKKSLIAYLFIFSLFTAIFLFSFHTSIFNKQSVLFYRGIILLFTTTIISFVVSFLLNKRFWNIGKETLFSAVIVSFSLHLCFFVVFPVTFDRSVTTYLLSALKEKPSSQTCQGINEKDLENYLINEYIIEKKAVRRRFFEQSIINNLEEQNNCIKLTDRGESFLKFSEFIMRIYSQKK